MGGGSGVTLSIQLEELQALIGEVRQLRQENRAIFQETAKHHAILNNLLAQTYREVADKSLVRYLQHIASLSTAEFVAENMITAKIFKNPLENLGYALEKVEIDGLFLEFGVFQGNTINFISTTKPDKTIYGFDSFEGLPENWRSGFEKEHFSLNGALPKVNGNVQLVKGWFNETLPDFVKEHPEVCTFIHVDSDLYSSAKMIFSELKDKIVKGTVIVFDEYFNYPSWQNGEHKAFTEFMEENNLGCEYISYNANHEQVAVKIK